MLDYFVRRQMEKQGYAPIKVAELENERSIWQEERGGFLGERQGLIREMESLRAERESLHREMEALRGERERLFEERKVLQDEAASLRNELEDIKHGRLNQLLAGSEKIPSFVNGTVQHVLRKQHRSVFWGDRLLSLDKSAGFYEDETFSEAVRAIRGSHVYDQYSGPDGIAWRLHTLVWAASCALEVEGDFVECGVFKGDMSWVVASAVGFEDRNRTFFLYDTFEGFSDKYSSADDFPLNPNFFDFANKEYSIPGLHVQVEKRFKVFPNVKVIKGVLPDVLSEEAPDRVAFLHIDLNSPTAEVGVLDRLFDRVVSGGMIVFDDYGWLEYVRQKREEDRFMKSRGYHILELPTGQGLVVKR